LVQQLLELLATQQQTIMRLSQRVQELEDRLGSNSRNSSQPPSADGFNRPAPRPKSLRRSTGKKPGGQPGHKGKTLPFSAHPDRVVEHSPQECAECGCPLDDVPPIPGATEARQVIDLPPMQLETTEHRAHAVRCPVCASLSRGIFPTEAADCVQYGPHIKALGLYLMSYQLLPYERTGELFTDLFGSAPSEGTLHRAQHRASCELVEVEEAIRQAIRQAEVANFDDTGMYIEGKCEASGCMWLLLDI
jgi:transposase